MKKFNVPERNSTMNRRIMGAVNRWNDGKRPHLYMPHTERFNRFIDKFGSPDWVYEQLIHRFCEAEC